MERTVNKPLLIAALVVTGVMILAALFVGTGIYNVAADEEHSALVSSLLATTRDRSIAVRAAKIKVPDLVDPQRVRRGAGNYDSMCAGCHLEPGARETELSRGLYPRPPELAHSANLDPARAFWVIKHGIKSTGMPAWGKSMEDSHIWDMVALLKQLPQMSPELYREEVRASGGHSHAASDQEGAGAEKEHSHDAEGHSHADDGEESARERQPDNGALSKDPLAVVEAFHQALSAGSASQVERLLDANVLIMEGGNVERSRQEYASHHLPADLKFMSAARYQLQRQSGDAVGDLAWVGSEATLTGSSAGKAIDLISTETLVLKRAVAGWKIVHIHWSSRNAKKG